MSRFAEVVERLAAVIEQRRGGDPAASWSARLLAACGVSLDEVAAKLEAREGRSGVEEKASRPG